jgi:hypothetical protein
MLHAGAESFVHAVRVDNIDSRLEDTGRAFLGAAWDRLLKERVAPPPAFYPYPRVGRDYFGGSVSSLAEYRALEEAIIASHPRFDTGGPLDEREFPDGLIFSFLDTFIARLTRERVEFSLG